jgi:hypothetical protein
LCGGGGAENIVSASALHEIWLRLRSRLGAQIWIRLQLQLTAENITFYTEKYFSSTRLLLSIILLYLGSLFYIVFRIRNILERIQILGLIWPNGSFTFFSMSGEHGAVMLHV